MRLPRLVAGGAVVAVLTGTAACGLGSVEPKLELRDAARAFAADDTGVIRLSIPSSVDEITAFTKAADSAADASSDIPDDALRTILSSSLDIGYDYGNDPKSDKDDASRLVLHIGDLDAGELRTVGRTMYAKVDVDGLVKEFPDLKPGVDEMRAGLTSADPSAGVPESVRGPATALLDGSWVSLDLQAWLDQLTAMAAGDGVDAAGTGLDSQASKKARDLAGTILSKALTTVERRETDDRLGDHLVAKVNLQEAYRQLRAGIPDVFSGSPKAEQMEGSLPPVASVPDKDIAISIWVRDTALTRLELDAAQFLDKPAGHLVLRADLLPAEKITAPTGAVPFDVDALVADLPAALGAGSSDPGSAMAGDIDAYTVATWVDEDIRAEADDNAIPPTPDVLDRVLQYYTDVAPGLLIFHVDQRIQVNLGGQSACLTLSGDVEQEGTVADGPC